MSRNKRHTNPRKENQMTDQSKPDDTKNDAAENQDVKPGTDVSGEPGLQADTTHQGIDQNDTLQGGDGKADGQSNQPLESDPPLGERPGDQPVIPAQSDSPLGNQPAHQPEKPQDQQEQPAQQQQQSQAPKGGEVLPKTPVKVGLTGKPQVQQAPKPTQAVTPKPQSSTPAKDAKQQPAETNKVGATKIEPRATTTPPETDEAALARILDGLSPSQITPIGKIKQYIDTMQVNRQIDPAVGAKQQIGLYRTLYAVINNEGQPFDQLWRAILKLVELNRNGVFHPANAFRFLDHASFTLNKDQLMSFRSLIDLLVLTSSTKGRDLASKSFDFNQALRYAQTEAGRARVLAFYNR